MISLKVKTLRFGAAVLALAVGGATAVEAQQIRTVYSPTQFREDASAKLARYVRSLADSPRSLSSLIGAGEAALELGDPQTALTFFARAEEVAPRDGRVKAGMGSSFLLMEEPDTAMRFFGEATALGLPPSMFAKDRGLAYDLAGDPARAQADYRLALQRGDDPETRQRLAVSLAISGNKDEALTMIDPLVKRSHRGAWRTRAFVLALTGDAEAALLATQAVMPAQAASMKPFYDQLPWLNPAQQASAVHFGHFPTGAQLAQSMRQAPAVPVKAAATPEPEAKPEAATKPAKSRSESKKERQARRRPSRSQSDQSERVGPASRAYSRSMQTASAQPRQPKSAPASSAGAGGKDEPEPSDPGPATPPATEPSFASLAAMAVGGEPPAPEPAPDFPSAPVAGAPAVTETALPPSASVAASAVTEPEVREPAPAKAPPPVVRLPFGPPTPGSPPRLADLSETVTRLPDVAAPAVKPPAKSDATTPEKKAKSAKKVPARPAEPSRHWVQLAGGADKAALPREYRRLKDKAPKLLIGKTAWTTPLRFTNRLLIGPFDSTREAQEFVNELGKVGVTAFSWTSPEGQEIVKLAAK